MSAKFSDQTVRVKWESAKIVIKHDKQYKIGNIRRGHGTEEILFEKLKNLGYSGTQNEFKMLVYTIRKFILRYNLNENSTIDHGSGESIRTNRKKHRERKIRLK